MRMRKAILTAGGTAIAAVAILTGAAPATAHEGDERGAGARMHAAMVSEDPAMARMHAGMVSRDPGMARMHAQMVSGRGGS